MSEQFPLSQKINVLKMGHKGRGIRNGILRPTCFELEETPRAIYPAAVLNHRGRRAATKPACSHASGSNTVMLTGETRKGVDLNRTGPEAIRRNVEDRSEWSAKCSVASGRSLAL